MSPDADGKEPSVGRHVPENIATLIEDYLQRSETQQKSNFNDNGIQPNLQIGEALKNWNNDS